MARRKLSSLLEQTEARVEEKPTDSTPAPTTPTNGTSATKTTKPAKKASAPKPPAQARSGDQPRYLTLQRKEARLSDDQVEELAAVTRKLNKTRSRTGERITDNTLIRVGVDLLLANASQLQGSTEAELRKSVGL